jgi:organic radical activating enzyme
MTSLKETIQSLFKPVQPLPPGMYHYQAPPDDPRNYRLHLRLEPDGSGVLIVNAATVLHLNRTAAEYAYYLVRDVPEEEVLKNFASRYRVEREKARQHYRDFIERIDTLVSTQDLDPVTFLDFDRQAPFSGKITAPYRLDCALTYGLRDSLDSVSAPSERVSRELSTQEWETILDKAWAAGIPHVVFTGGEPTLRDDLAKLIAHAEGNSQVTGLLSDGLSFSDQAYLEELLQTGLDHLMMIYQSENENATQALINVLAADLFVAVHLTLTDANQGKFAGLLDELARRGVRAISLSANDPALKEQLAAAREQAAHLNFELVWNLPVPYSSLNPVALETEDLDQPEGVGRAWLYVEPDGDVLPGQGINQVLGNFLGDPWEKIWQPG